VDVECLRSIGSSNHEKARDRLHALMDELYRQTGRYAMIYTSRSMWTRVVGRPASFGRYRLWVACWRCDTMLLPRGWDDWLFWQIGLYRYKGLGGLDGNVFRSTAVERLQDERQRPIGIERGREYALEQNVMIDLRGIDGADVRVGLDGGEFGDWRPFDKSLRVDLGGPEGERNVRLQARSFRGVVGPVFRDSILLDSVPPDLDGPTVTLTKGARLPLDARRAPASVSMAADDSGSGVESAELSATCSAEAGSQRIRQAGDVDLDIDLAERACRIDGQARDIAGHHRIRELASRMQYRDFRLTSASQDYRGRWSKSSSGQAIGGSTVRTSAEGASVKLRFRGAQVAIVGRRSPAGGLLTVIVDGEEVGTVDLYAPDAQQRRVVFVRNVSRGDHSLKLVATGDRSAESNGAEVTLDGIVTLDRRR
jgi:hypothetical protein